MQGYLVEVPLHGVGVGEGQRQRRAHAARRADGAEQVGALVALVGGLDRPRAAARPLPDKAVLLADPRLVLEPDLDLLLARHAREVGRERARGSFFERLDDLAILLGVTRPGADVREAQSLEQLADGALVILDPEPLSMTR